MGVSQLHFPTTGDQSVLLPPKADGTADYELRNGNSATSLADQRAVSLTVSDVKGAKGFAMLLPEATVSATPALIAPSTMQTAPVAYFVNPTDGSCNFVQTDAPYTSLELGDGYKRQVSYCSKEMRLRRTSTLGLSTQTLMAPISLLRDTMKSLSSLKRMRWTSMI